MPPNPPDPFRTLTPDVRKMFLRKLKKGLNRTVSANLCGLSVNTMKKALEIGARALEDYEQYDCPFTGHAAFYQDVIKAEAGSVEDYGDKLATMTNERPELWAGEMTFKQRTDAERYGMRQAVAVEQNTKVTINWKVVDGQEWQSGGIITESVMDVPLIASGADADVIDTTMSPSLIHDDHDF